MRDLITEIKNFFSDLAITDKMLDPFAGSALNKVLAINTTGVYAGKFTAPLAVLSLAYNPFHDAMLKLPFDLTLGAGSVEIRESVVDDFKRFVSNYKGIVKDKYFLTKHHLYIQFYVDDLKDYNAMNKSNSLLLINRYATAAHTNVADFTPEFDAKAASFVLRYNNAKEGQDVASGSIGFDRSDRNSGRDDVDEALFELFNFCKYIFKADYNKMHNVFPLETLSRHPRNEINHYSGSVNALATVNVSEAIYDLNIIALVRNKSDCDMLVGLATTADAAVSNTNGIVVKAKKSKSFTIINTGIPGDHFLNVTNLNLTDDGNWEIDIFKQS